MPYRACISIYISVETIVKYLLGKQNKIDFRIYYHKFRDLLYHIEK